MSYTERRNDVMPSVSHLVVTNRYADRMTSCTGCKMTVKFNVGVFTSVAIGCGR